MHDEAVSLYPQTYPTAQLQKMENSPINQPISLLGYNNPHESLLGPENTVTVCQYCHASIKTAVKYTVTSRTHIAAALWCLACCLFCIPYASDSAKNTDHYCPLCHRYLGTYNK